MIRTGEGPIPPQRDRPIEEYARAATARRGLLPELLFNTYFLAGFDDPPLVAERERLIRGSFQELLDVLSQSSSLAATSSHPGGLSPGWCYAALPFGIPSLRGMRTRRIATESAKSLSSCESVRPAPQLKPQLLSSQRQFWCGHLFLLSLPYVATSSHSVCYPWTPSSAPPVIPGHPLPQPLPPVLPSPLSSQPSGTFCMPSAGDAPPKSTFSAVCTWVQFVPFLTAGEHVFKIQTGIA